MSKTAGLFASNEVLHRQSCGRVRLMIEIFPVCPSSQPGDVRSCYQIEKQLNKKIDVIKVRRFAENKCVTRELLMLKVTYTNVTRSDIMEICNITGAHIAGPFSEVHGHRADSQDIEDRSIYQADAAIWHH